MLGKITLAMSLLLSTLMGDHMGTASNLSNLRLVSRTKQFTIS